MTTTTYKLDGTLPKGKAIVRDLHYRDYAIVVAKVQCARRTDDVDNPQPKVLRVRELVMLSGEEAEQVQEILRGAMTTRGQLTIPANERDELLAEIRDIADEHIDEAGGLEIRVGKWFGEDAALTGLDVLQLKELRAHLEDEFDIETDEDEEDERPVDTVDLPEFSDEEPIDEISAEESADNAMVAGSEPVGVDA
jgi:hypothetical protein